MICGRRRLPLHHHTKTNSEIQPISQPLCTGGGGVKAIIARNYSFTGMCKNKCYFNYPHDTVFRYRYSDNWDTQSSHRLRPYGRWRWKRTTNSRHTLNRLSEPVFFRGGRSGAVEAAPFSTFPWLSFRRGGGSHFLLQQQTTVRDNSNTTNLISKKTNRMCCL